MKLGIMQPYFMPYIGYWQLISQVDKYVVFDDVNFIKKGWINRNRILLDGREYLFVLPLQGASQNRKINELAFFEGPANKKALWERIERGYGKSPCFQKEDAAALLKSCILCEEDEIVKYITHSIRQVCRYLDIETEIVLSSEIDKDMSCKGQEKILDICEKSEADTYLNAIGGMELYDGAVFHKRGIRLQFLKTDFVKYPQQTAEFMQGLSLIDILCSVPKAGIKAMLNQCTLVENLPEDRQQQEWKMKEESMYGKTKNSDIRCQ